MESIGKIEREQILYLRKFEQNNLAGYSRSGYLYITTNYRT